MESTVAANATNASIDEEPIQPEEGWQFDEGGGMQLLDENHVLAVEATDKMKEAFGKRDVVLSPSRIMS